MQSKATSVEDYLNEIPATIKPYFEKLRSTILKNLPKGYEEVMNYGMIGYVVPHSIYPAGYHCKPELPLPFINLASQKNAISLYHMGIYADPELLAWFTAEYPKHSKARLDMGKSCIRFKKAEDIPFELIGELVKKIPVKKWITIYEATYRNQKK
ncbi:MAG TPA: DUF1801 domain-containing protein [Niabella sp.]|nr:DUF1801 domain-containing protein [Niabella sp.]